MRSHELSQAEEVFCLVEKRFARRSSVNSFAPEQQSQTQLWVYWNIVSAADTIVLTSDSENILDRMKKDHLEF